MGTMRPRSILALVLTAAPVFAGAPATAHALAYVNDPKSHGQLGDNLLSLNEAIQLNQGTITVTQLSLPEQQQILGVGADVAVLVVNFNLVPRITLERDLDTIFDVPHGTVIQGSSGRAVLDCGPHRGLFFASTFADVRGIDIEGGDTGIRIDQTSALYGTTISGVTFRGQRNSGIQFVAQGRGNTELFIEDTQILDAPTAIQFFDSDQPRTGQVSLRDVTIQGGSYGLRARLGGFGGALTVSFLRTEITGTTHGVSFERRPNSGLRDLTISALYTNLTGGDIGMTVEGRPGATSRLTARMSEFAGRSVALTLGRLGATSQALIQDCRLAGDVTLLGGGEWLPSTPEGRTVNDRPALAADNVAIVGGTTLLGSNGDPVRVKGSRLQTVTIRTAGAAPIRVRHSRLDGCVTRGSPTAPLRIEDSYVGSSNLGTRTITTSALPAPQLGSFDVTPLDPQLTATISFQADLPPGLAGVWIAGLADLIPTVTPNWRLYFFLSAHVVFPVAARDQDRLDLHVPNDPGLLGQDFVVQMAVVPDPGVQAPSIWFPPGRRFVVR